MEQKAGHVNWQDVNSLVRPRVVRLFTYQLDFPRRDGHACFSAGASRASAREKFYGAVLPHHGRKDSRTFKEISQIGEEMKLLAPALKGTKVVAEVCILYSHDNDWALQQPMQPNKLFNLREHIQLIYNALHRPQHPGGFRAAHGGSVANTNSSSRPRCTCWPAARPTG